MSNTLEGDKYHSPCWYLAPALTGIIGGLIAFFALRRDAPHMSKYCLLIGIISEFVFILIFDIYLMDECSVWFDILSQRV